MVSNFYSDRSRMSELHIQDERQKASTHLFYSPLLICAFLVNTAGSIAVVYTIIGTTNLFNVSHAQTSHTVQFHVFNGSIRLR